MSSTNNQGRELITPLIDKLNRGKATSEELEVLDNWYDGFEQDEDYTSGMPMAEVEKLKAKLWLKISSALSDSGVRKNVAKSYPLWPKFLVAACVLVVLGLGIFFYQYAHKKSEDNADYANDVKPGKKAATLVLSDGRKIYLADEANGKLAIESGVKITKSANGEIVYTISSNPSLKPVEQKLITYKGERQTAILPDGSKVYLNAASSLKFPSYFSGADRKVELIGEAYFEVAKNKLHPFTVSTRSQQVKVLGTHFNVKAYDDEPSVNTTLLEGSVRVSADGGGTGALLKPGEESVLSELGIRVVQADIEEAVAWKDGYLRFNDMEVSQVMKQLSRWYDVEVVYDTDASKVVLSGAISSNRNLSQVLKMLEKTGEVHFRIEGKKIYVLK